MRKETSKEKAKRRKSFGNTNKRVSRNYFESTPQRSIRRKSHTGKSASSTKIGKGNYLTRAMTALKRIIKKP